MLYLLSYPHLMGVHMPQLRVKPFVLFLNYSNRLLVVAVDDRLNLRVKFNVLENTDPPLHLSTRS
jgi:hypothetical protein